jgi:hypothetical protein
VIRAVQAEVNPIVGEEGLEGIGMPGLPPGCEASRNVGEAVLAHQRSGTETDGQ